jgi:integrase
MSTYFNKDKSRWIFDFDKVIGGHRIRATKTLPAGWNRAKAQAFDKAETDRLYAIATGATKERPLISDAVALYYKHQCGKLKNGDGVKKELARIHQYFDGRYIDELADVAREYANAERDRLTPATIRNKLAYLRAACRYAQKHHGFGAGESLIISMPVVRNERKYYATRAEMIRIARKCTCWYARALIRLGFYSGMRLGEMMSIGDTSSIIDDGFLLVDTKNGDDRIVPMHPKVRVLCRFFPIPYKKRWMQRKFEEARDAAELHHLHFHDLRHSSASAMINAGIDLYTVGKVLGHKDQRSSMRYAHLNTESLAKAIRKIG